MPKAGRTAQRVAGALVAVVLTAGAMPAEAEQDSADPEHAGGEKVARQEAGPRAAPWPPNAFLEEVESLRPATTVQARPKPNQLVAEQIARALVAQQEAWNRGDVDAFMRGYGKSENLRFATGGKVVKGWRASVDDLRGRYDSGEKMGRLKFSDLDITVLSKDSALAFGRWNLEHNGDALNGLFTQLFRKTDGRWLIVHDHTSSE